MNTRVLLAVLLMGAVMVLTGCATTDEKNEDPLSRPGDLRVGPDLQYSDLPVPQDFEYVAADSFSAQGTGFRVGEFVYKGDADAFELIRFYRSQMPANGWEETRNLDIGSRAILFFQKEDERCTVIIRRSAMLRSSLVKISLW